MSWDLGHETNPKSAKWFFKNLSALGDGPKPGKLLRKNRRKPHFRNEEVKRLPGGPTRSDAREHRSITNGGLFARFLCNCGSRSQQRLGPCIIFMAARGLVEVD
jgi:hypothetical protein